MSETPTIRLRNSLTDRSFDAIEDGLPLLSAIDACTSALAILIGILPTPELRSKAIGIISTRMPEEVSVRTDELFPTHDARREERG